MKELVIALAYRNNPAMLREWQRVISDYPIDVRAKTRLIVVDDASAKSPAHEAAWTAPNVVFPLDYQLEIYRIVGQEMPWTHIRPRNLGVFVAPAGAWVLATDIDHVLPAECAKTLLEFEPLAGNYYTFTRRMPTGEATNPHANSYLFQREWFLEDVGGLNEDFVGWYGTDSIFRARAPMFGKCVLLPNVWLVVYNRDGIDIGGIPGAATNLPRKGSLFHARSNQEIARKMKRAHEVRPERPLRFQYERLI